MAFAEWIKPLFDIGTAAAENIVPFAKAIAGVVKWVLEAKPLLFFFGAVIAGLGISFIAANAGFWLFLFVSKKRFGVCLVFIWCL